VASKPSRGGGCRNGGFGNEKDGLVDLGFHKSAYILKMMGLSGPIRDEYQKLRYCILLAGRVHGDRVRGTHNHPRPRQTRRGLFLYQLNPRGDKTGPIPVP
jgi:hypothetical protein